MPRQTDSHVYSRATRRRHLHTSASKPLRFIYFNNAQLMPAACCTTPRQNTAAAVPQLMVA